MDSMFGEDFGIDLTNLEMFPELADLKTENDLTDSASPLSDVKSVDWEKEEFDWSNVTIPLTVDGALLLTVTDSPVEDQSVLSPSSSKDSDSGGDIVSKTHVHLMRKYSLTDSKLSDITLKHLKSLCGRNYGDFKELKTYRRTCLNRSYARSSRTKQQEKTTGLSSQLDDALVEIERLRKQIMEKDMTIQHLQLENRLLLAFKQN